jgi:outer membrane protein assembly factor BamB
MMPVLTRFYLPVAVALSTLLPTAFAETVAMFRSNPAHTGVYNTTGVAQLTGVKWKFKTGGRVLSSPAVADGTVYVGSEDKNLYAVDARTGEQRWKFATEGAVHSSPAVAGGMVYFASYDGKFYAVDAQTGKLRWKFETGGERRFEAKGLHGYQPHNQTIPDSWDMYLSSPTVDKGLVYFGSGDGSQYALDAQTGTLKWKVNTGDIVHSSPAVLDGVAYFASWDSYLYAVDAQTGAQKWRFKTGEDKKVYNQVGIQSSPAVADGVVYFGCRDNFAYAVDAKTGLEKWKFPNNYSWVVASPAVYGGSVYFGTSDSKMFHALDIQSGKARFSTPTKGNVFSSPAIAAGMAYFGGFDGKLQAVDIKSGKYVWEFATDAARQNAHGYLAPDGKLNQKAVYLSDFYDDMILAVDRLMSLGSIVSSPAVDSGAIYFGSGDGSLYALQ